MLMLLFFSLGHTSICKLQTEVKNDNVHMGTDMGTVLVGLYKLDSIDVDLIQHPKSFGPKSECQNMRAWQISQIKEESLDFGTSNLNRRLQEAAVDAIITGKRKAWLFPSTYVHEEYGEKITMEWGKWMRMAC